MADSTPDFCTAGGDSITTDVSAEHQEVTSVTPSPKLAESLNGAQETPVTTESCPLLAAAPSGDFEAHSKLEKDGNPNNKDVTEANNNETITISKLQKEITKRSNERDNYQKKLEETEKKLAELQASYNAVTSTDGDEISLRREMEDLKNSLTQTKLALTGRERVVANQENQINALSKQVSSLKEVVSITKDLLNIRNMEVKHLQEDVNKMETRISNERERHSIMLDKMDAAARLNADLKKEYETQLQLFQDLRGKYEEKVTLLSAENKALESAVQAGIGQ